MLVRESDSSLDKDYGTIKRPAGVDLKSGMQNFQSKFLIKAFNIRKWIVLYTTHKPSGETYHYIGQSFISFRGQCNVGLMSE